MAIALLLGAPNARGETRAATAVNSARLKNEPHGGSTRPEASTREARETSGVTNAKPAPIPDPLHDVNALGSLSVGHPHAGFLFNAVRLPKGEHWLVSDPKHAYGTEETIDNLIRCFKRVNEQFPDSPKVVVGSISAERGGPFPPHKSHRTGLDADVYFYRKPGTKTIYRAATAEDLDRARTWALLKAVVTETDVEFVLIDKAVQAWLEEYALSHGEDPVWVKTLFHGNDQRRSLVKHIPGHVAHMHIRFFSPVARERGRREYDRLVAQGHIPLPATEVVHEVVAGDTLLGLAQRYATSVQAIKRLNDLTGSVIKVGQKLRVRKQEDLRGARARIVVPPRLLPPDKPTSERLARTHTPTP